MDIRFKDLERNAGEPAPRAYIHHTSGWRFAQRQPAAQRVEKMLDANLLGIGDTGEIETPVPFHQFASIQVEGRPLLVRKADAQQIEDLIRKPPHGWIISSGFDPHLYN